MRVGKFYEKLSESFKELQIIGWSDFEQEYLYDIPTFVTLISRKDIPLSRKFKDTKNVSFVYFKNFMNDYNLALFAIEYFKVVNTSKYLKNILIL